MAIYTTLEAQNVDKHGMFRSSRLKATDVGRIYDLIVRDDSDKEIAVDNGVAVKVGSATGSGLQTRYATVAKIGDKVAIVGSPATIKDSFTSLQAAEYNFYHKAGVVAKAYEVRQDEAEVFGVAAYQFTTVIGSVPAVGNLVVVDGNGGYTELASGTDVSTYGFVGTVYGYETGDNETIVLIEVIKNEQL
jgi:hypothetical protein